MFSKKIVLLSLILLCSCTNLKEGLSFKKKQSVDEFLIEKKKPLVVPPDFLKLPKPIKEIESTKNQSESDSIEELVNEQTLNTENKNIPDSTDELENSISNILKSK